MQVSLIPSERFALIEILPTTGSFATLKLIRKLREKLSFNEAELKEYHVQQKGDQILWDNARKAKELDFSDFEASMIKQKLNERDTQQRLEDRHLTVYEKFIEGAKQW